MCLFCPYEWWGSACASTSHINSLPNFCKNLIPKNLALQVNILNTVWNISLKFSSPSDPANQFSSILEKGDVQPCNNCLKTPPFCFELTINENMSFMGYLWFDFLSQGQLGSRIVVSFFFNAFKVFLFCKYVFRNFLFCTHCSNVQWKLS